jgi:fatty acid desaturase
LKSEKVNRSQKIEKRNMTIKEIIVAVIIHLIIPTIGIFLFLKLIAKMKSDNIIHPPILEFFIIFATYGGLLLVMLTSIFWKWSGLASLGTFYLILGAPILLGFIAFQQFKKRKISKYHNWAFQTSILYYVIAPSLALIIYLTEPKWIH